MSTKTTIKRISAVAALALALGGLTTVAAQAANYSETLSIASTSATIAPGGTASVVVTNSFLTDATPAASVTTAYLISSPAGNAVLPVFSLAAGQIAANAAANSTVTASTQTSSNIGNASSVVTGVSTLSLVAPSVAGTYVVKLISSNANVAPLVWTVTVSARDPITAASSTFIPALTTALSARKLSGAQAGVIAITADNAAHNASQAVLSATVSGPGLVSFGGLSSAGRAVSQSIGNTGTLTVYADGTAGVGTITIYSGTTVIGTTTATFYGTPVKYTVTALKKVVIVSNLTPNVISVSAVDTAGSAVPLAGFGAALTLTSDATGSIPSTLSGADTASTGCSITVVCYSVNAGATAGTANLTFTDTTNTISAAPVAVRVSSGVPTKVGLTTDASSYTIVSPLKVTATVSDAAGVLPAGTYTVFDSNGIVVPGSLGLGAYGGGTTITTTDDTGTFTFPTNSPFSDGTFSISATGATGVTVTPATYTVVSSSTDAANAASDAAAEATDAANAATDAANAAADSADQATAAATDAGDKADAALAAVMALSQQVTDLLDKITALSDANAQLADALASQSAALASQAKTVAAQSKALAAQKALVARLVRKAKA